MNTRKNDPVEKPPSRSALAPVPLRPVTRVKRVKPTNIKIPTHILSPLAELNVDENGKSTGAPFPWYKDESIVARVERVTRLELQGYSYRQIAKLEGMALSSVQLDIDRMRALRGAVPQDEDSRRINRQRSVEVFRAVQREAWRRLDPNVAMDMIDDADKLASTERLTGESSVELGGDTLPSRGRKYLPTAREAAELLNQVVASEREIMRLQGTTQQEAPKDAFDTNTVGTIVAQLTHRFTARLSGSVGEGAATGANQAAWQPDPGAIEGDTVPLAVLGEGDSTPAD